MANVLALWRRLSALPGGKTLFSRLVCRQAPYFGSIRPRFAALDESQCEVRITKRRAVTNHIGTVHAIAMCNMAELSGGVLTDINVPARTHRWIPKGMQVNYLKKAETDLRAVARLAGPVPLDAAGELPVTVDVLDTRDQVVFSARIAMWVSPKK